MEKFDLEVYKEKEKIAIEKWEKDVPLKKTILREYLIICILLLIVSSIIIPSKSKVSVIEEIYNFSNNTAFSLTSKILLICACGISIIFPILILIFKRKKIKDFNDDFKKYFNIFLIIFPTMLSLLFCIILFFG